MLLESAVAIMALVAACTLHPGVYFAMNAPAAMVGNTVDEAARVITQWGFPVEATHLTQLAHDLGENTVLGRAGGAPTLAVGMANVFSSIVGGQQLMAVWYHFAIMFEALFILTTVDAGTRVGRFLVQAMLKHVHPHLGDTSSWSANLTASVLLVAGWGYFLYQGVVDPLGGINSLWPLFGIANQLLAVIALCLATTVLLKLGQLRTSFVTLVPLAWVGSVTFTAAWQKIFSANPKIGFLSAARGFGEQLTRHPVGSAQAQVLTRTQFNLRVDAVVAGLFLLLVSAIVLISLWRWAGILAGQQSRELKETPIVWLTPEQLLKNPAHHFSRTVHGVGLFCLGLARQLVGETPGPTSPDVCSSGHTQLRHRAALGKAWAERVHAKSNQPRCC
jgi:carbon starvation protein